jgi:hypothetical protein
MDQIIGTFFPGELTIHQHFGTREFASLVSWQRFFTNLDSTTPRPVSDAAV